jgi:hypothetical protein
MSFGERQFEKPGAQVNPEGESAGGQPGEEAVEQSGGPEGAAEEGTEEEMTEEKIEARFQERLSKIAALKKEVEVEYKWDFLSLRSGVRDAKMEVPGVGKEPLFRDQNLIALIEGIDQKEKEINDEKRKSLKALEEKGRTGLKEKLEGI